MATRKSSSSGSSRGARQSASSNRNRAARVSADGSARARRANASRGATVADGAASVMEQLVNRILKPLGVVMLTRDRIQETLDEAAERGRVTRSDANELVTELVRRGREQTDELLSDVERLVGRSRDQLGSATKRTRLSEPMDRIVRTADRARRTIGVGPSVPLVGYDDLTARQVDERLKGLTPAELRRVRDYELRHANRKSVLIAIERGLA
jgi:polyhydroxyalkanoate synthesis regulator phasin